MKIAYIITRSDVMGGASYHLLDLAHGAQHAGHEVFILVGGEGIFVDKARERNLSCVPLKHLVREINLYQDILCLFELKTILTRVNPDLIHLHSSKAGVLGRLVARMLRKPNVFTAHGWSFTEGVSAIRRWGYRNVERYMANFTNKIIAVSEYDRQLALYHKVGNSDLISVVHNGIHASSPGTRGNETTREIRLIMVARFDEPKNQAALLRALASLKDLSWVLEFVGDGSRLVEVKKLAASLGLENRVLFSGACDDVPKRLMHSDIFLLISNWEGFPLTILEAMRAGLPLIASDVGGVKEAIDHEKTGFLIPRNDESSLVEAIRTLVNSTHLRKIMGEKGRLKFSNQFTFELMLSKTLEIYDEMLSKKL